MTEVHRRTAVAGALIAMGAAALGWSAVAALVCVMGVGYGVCVVDLQERRIPAHLLGIGAAGLVGVAAALSMRSGGVGPIGHLLVGALLLGGAVAVVHIAAPSGMGLGDVRLAGFVGAGVSVGARSITAVLAVGLCSSLAVLAVMTVGRRRSMPYGPFLVVASIAALTVAVASPGVWR